MKYRETFKVPQTRSGYLASKLYSLLSDYKGVVFKQYSSYQTLQVGASRVLRIWYVSPRTARLEVSSAIHGLLQHSLKGWQEANQSSPHYTHQCPLRLDEEPERVASAVKEMYRLELKND